jgi:hypothetical protein
MLIIKDKEYKLRRNISIDFKNITLIDSDISGDIDYLYEIYKIKKEDCDFKKLIDIINCLNMYSKSRMLFKYLTNVGYNEFKIDNFIKYMEFKIDNPKDTSSSEYYKILYDDKWLVKMKERSFNVGLLYNRNYISNKYNISLEEADVYIEEFKKNKTTNLSGFINRHGLEKGSDFFKKFQETSKHTLNKYIEEYGQLEGNRKWNEYTLIKSKTSAFNKNFWIKRGLSEKDSIKKVRDISDNSSLDYFRRIYKYEDIAKREFLKLHKRRNVKFNNASKESLIYFTKLTSILIENGIKYDDILYGVEDKSEHFIFHDKGWYLYDYTILSYKIIIEYNGEKWHPNPMRMTLENWSKWKCISSGISADEKYKKDEKKKKHAMDNGYSFLEIWSDDSFEYNWDKIISFIEKNINIKMKNEK